MSVVLGAGWPVPVMVEEPPPPAPGDDLLTQVMLAVQALQATFAQMPTPQVHVEPQDFADIVTAVQDLKGPNVSAEDIAAAVKDALLTLPAPAPQADVVSPALVKALEALDFRMKGIGAGGVGGTVATISNDVAVKPAAGTTAFPVSGNVTVSGTVAVSESPGEEDMFGTQIVGSLNNLIEVHFDDAAYASFLSVTNSGAGAGPTQANGRVQWASGTTASGSSTATSLDSAVYRPHFPTYAAFTAAFVTPPTGATDLAVLGLGDLTNGTFVGYKGSSFGVLLRQGGADTFIPQGSFSEAAQSITLTNGNVFKVEVGLFGYAGYRVRWWNPTTRGWVTLHQATPASAEPLFTNFDLPMTLQIKKNASDATNIKVNTACWGAGSSSLQTRMTDTITDRSLAATVRSVIIGKSTAGGTSYVPVKVNPSGTLATGNTSVGTTGTAIPTDATLLGGSDGTNLQALKVDASANLKVSDQYPNGEVLADQVGAGAVLTFTFATARDLIWVRDIGATTTNVSRVDPFGGTPSASVGIPLPNNEPIPITRTASVVKVYAPAGSTISVWGYSK